MESRRGKKNGGKRKKGKKRMEKDGNKWDSRRE